MEKTLFFLPEKYILEAVEKQASLRYHLSHYYDSLLLISCWTGASQKRPSLGESSLKSLFLPMKFVKNAR